MKKYLFLILFCFFISHLLQAQCLFSSNIEVDPLNIKSHQANQYKSNGATLRLTVYILRKDDGTGGVQMDIPAVQSLFQEVNMAFDMSGISFDVCVRELYDSYRLNLPFSSEKFYDGGCNSLHLVLVPQNFGLARLGGNLSFSGPDVSLIAHELGHNLGLVHTFNNCGHPNLGECVQDFCPNGPYITVKGDFVCDTPADSGRDSSGNNCERAFPRANDDCEYDYANSPPNTLRLNDPCNDPYADPGNLILKNFMSYNVFECQTQFSAGQIERMCATIALRHQDRVGTLDMCISDPITSSIEKGIIEQDEDFTGLDLELNTSLIIRNCEVNLFNSNIAFDRFNKIILENATLNLYNTTLGSFSFSCSNNSSFTGVSIIGNSIVRLFDDSKIEAVVPIDATSVLGAERVVVGGNNYELVGTSGTAINSDVTALIVGDQVEINGSFDLKEADIFGIGNYIGLTNTNIQGNRSNGINLFSGQCYLLDNVHIKGFQSPLNLVKSSIWIHRAFLESNGQAARFSNSDYTLLRNSHLEKCKLNISDAAYYNILNNNFNGCSGVDCADNIEISGENTKHSVTNNIIKAPNRGLNALNNMDTKFLCNKFEESSDANFTWRGVNLLQGVDQFKASGNIFSDNTQDQIGGFSPGVSYNYNENAPQEILIPNQYSNLGLTPIALITAAGCGPIGPDWVSPADIDSDDPDVNLLPDPDDQCPLGIDCTQVCPSGINCKDDCPPGIDCTQDCPSGIDCTVPCPPGIDCTVPCPPGVDCTVPCPNGVDCDPIGDPDDDVILERIEHDYIALENEKNNYEEALYPEDDSDLKSLVDNQLLENKSNLIDVLGKNPKKLGNGLMKNILANSDIYTEKEMLQILLLNPLNLHNREINRIVFHTHSFSDENIGELNNSFQSYSASAEASDLWAIDAIEYHQAEMIQYALRRLSFYSWKAHDMQHVWSQRSGNLKAMLISAERYFSNKELSKVDQVFSEISNMNTISESEKNDAQEFKALLNMLSEAEQNSEDLKTLSPERLNLLRNYSLSNNTFTRAKAQGILSAFYEEEFSQSLTNDQMPNQLQFLRTTSIGDIDDLSSLRIYPNPSSGSFRIDSDLENVHYFQVYDTQGKLVLRKALQKGKQQVEINSKLEAGVYICKVMDSDDAVVETKKLIIL